MRLIDADKLIYSEYTNMFDEQIVFDTVTKARVDSMPTIKAIPIEWIKKQAFEHPHLNRNLFYRMIIDEWEKEYGIQNKKTDNIVE